MRGVACIFGYVVLHVLASSVLYVLYRSTRARPRGVSRGCDHGELGTDTGGGGEGAWSVEVVKTAVTPPEEFSKFNTESIGENVIKLLPPPEATASGSSRQCLGANG